LSVIEQGIRSLITDIIARMASLDPTDSNREEFHDRMNNYQGMITSEFTQALLERLFLRFNERINVLSYEAAEGRAGFRTNDNITIGGLYSEGNDATSLLSHMVLEAYVHIHLTDPPLSVRVHKNTPHDFLQKVLEALRLGGGMPKIISDEVLIPAFLANGVSIRDTRNFADLGCQENVTDPM
jgi:formate C-acetyltransferase